MLKTDGIDIAECKWAIVEVSWHEDDKPLLDGKLIGYYALEIYFMDCGPPLNCPSR